MRRLKSMEERDDLLSEEDKVMWKARMDKSIADLEVNPLVAHFKVVGWEEFEQMAKDMNIEVTDEKPDVH